VRHRATMDRRGRLTLRRKRFGDLTTHESEEMPDMWAARTVCAASISTPRSRRWATPPVKECKMQLFHELREE